MKKIKYDNFYHYNRNYGCRLKEIIYKGYRTLILENEKLKIAILLDKGTDIIELVYKPEDIDFMWKSPIELNGLKRTAVTMAYGAGSFLDEYEGGWQELLPNMGAPHNYKGSSIGLHGELFSLPWNYSVITDDVYEVKIKLFTRMVRTPFFIEKFITIRSNEANIEFAEKILNEADEEFKFMWGHHPAIGKPFLDENCVIDLPEGLYGKTYPLDLSEKNILPLDIDVKWPFIVDKSGINRDLSKIMPPSEKTDFRIYLEGFKEGWYGITNLNSGIGFGMEWDINVFKYLWLWFSYRGFYNFPFYGRCYTIALEPWTAIPDNLDEVIKLKRELTLKPGELIETKYRVLVYKSNKRINGIEDMITG